MIGNKINENMKILEGLRSIKLLNTVHKFVNGFANLQLFAGVVKVGHRLMKNCFGQAVQHHCYSCLFLRKTNSTPTHK